MDSQNDRSRPACEEQLQKPAKAKAQKLSFGKSLLLYLHDLSYLIAIMMVLFLLLFRVVVVSGPSMESTLIDGDYVLLLSGALYSEPECGDIIVASKDSFDDGVPVVKRVIAVEGQTVQIRGGTSTVYVDGQPLSEAYTFFDPNYIYTADLEITVPEDHVFVMGDHRRVSLDSRNSRMGLLNEREIMGKAIFLFLPGEDAATGKRDLSRIGGLDNG